MRSYFGADETPVGTQCLWCHEEFVDGDDGVILPGVKMGEGGELEATGNPIPLNIWSLATRNGDYEQARDALELAIQRKEELGVESFPILGAWNNDHSHTEVLALFDEVIAEYAPDDDEAVEGSVDYRELVPA